VKAYFHDMAAAEKTSFLTRIRAALPGLHPSERQLAEAILSFPGQLASYTATELAQMAGVSNATVTRFVRRIGYASFEEARQAVRAEQSAGTALFRVNRGGDPPEGRIARHLDQGQRNMQDSLAALSETEIADLVACMASARRLRMIGFRAGQPFARYLAWQVMQVHADVATLPRDGETLAESLAGIGLGDCVIVFALRRPPRQIAALIRELSETGAATALIGDLPGLQALPARWHLPCATTGAGALFDHAGVMAICGLLASGLIEESGTAGRSRLSAIEKIHDALDEI
jgi:DNA-binding MurR/RpiR family transcriptional regulator